MAFSDAEWMPMLVESGVKDVVPAGRKYKPIPRQTDNPVKMSLYSFHVFNFLFEDGCGNSMLFVSVANRLDI